MKAKRRASKAPKPSEVQQITGGVARELAPDHSLVSYYAGMSPGDARLAAANLATGDGAAILAIALALLEENKRLRWRAATQADW